MAFNVDKKYITLTEEKLGIVFPESYRNAMMNNNGGLVISPQGEEEGVWFCFPFYDDSDKKRLKRTANDLTRENKIAWDDFGLPKELVAIASADDEYLTFKINQDKQLDATVYQYHHSYGLEKLADDFSLLTHEP